MGASFKTCLFGGFDREDVISFIEKSSREAKERIAGLEQENATLKEDNTAMASELQSLRDVCFDHNETLQAKQQLEEQVSRISERLAALEEETTRLRQQAEEYQGMKDHIAEIEITAHKHTEEFRAATIAQLRQVIAQQRSWCEITRTQYAALNDQFVQKLDLARQTIENSDMGSFDDMLNSLQAISDTLE